MKKKITLIAIIAVLILTLFSALSFATEVEPITLTDELTDIVIEGENIVPGEEMTQESKDEVIEDDFYLIVDESYTMDKLVDGNAYFIVDGDLTFSGTVTGAVYILANGTVEFTEESYIADAIYVLAENVKVNGEVYDIYSASESFELMENGYVSRDLRAVASDIKLRGIIYRDAHLNATNIDVKDEQTELFIIGDFNYSSPTEIEGIEDIVQYGNVNFSLQEEETEETMVEKTSDKIKDYSINALTSVVYVLVIYGILKLIAPKFIEKSGADIKEKSIVAFSVGLLTWVIVVLAVVVSIIVALMPLGLPVAIITWIVMLVVIYASSAVFTISILEIIKEKAEKIKGNVGLEILSLSIIAIIVWLLQEIPYIGGVASFIVVTTGVGLIIRNIIVKRETKTEEITPVVEETNTTEQ